MNKLLKDKGSELFKFIFGMLILSLAASIFVFIRVKYRGNLRYVFLIWNLFLAWVPFSLSVLFVQYNFKNKLFKYIVGFFWLVFYPNAPYIITDFIHLSAYNFYSSKNNSYPFNTSFNIWYDFFLICIFVILGIILDYASLNIMHQRVNKKSGGVMGWLFVIFVSILSGYAIYLGRFIRVNSWEIVTNPLYLLNVIFENINRSGVIFSFLYGMMAFSIYISFKMFEYYNPK